MKGNPPFFSDRRNVLLTAIFAAALMMRAVFLCTVSNYYWYGGMVGGARILAKNIAEGRGYVTGDKQARWFNESFDFNKFVEGAKLPMVEDIPTFADDVYIPFFARPPGYPLLIALSYRLFGTGWAMSIAQIVADSAVTILVFMIALSLGSRRAAYIAAVIYALWPPFARNSVHGTPDSLVPILLAGFVLLSLRMLESGRARYALLGGLVVGALAYVRGEFVIFGYFFAGVVTLLDRSRIRQGIAVALIALASMTPLLVRNYRLTGQPLSGVASMGIWQAMGEYPNPWGARYSDELLARELKKLGLQNDLIAANAFYNKRVSAAIAQHPFFFLSEVARRFPRALFPKTDWGFVAVHMNNPGFHALQAEGKPMTIVQFFRLNPAVFLIKTVPWAADTILVVLAIVGLYLALRKRPRAAQRQALLVFVPPAFALAFYPLIYYEPRYVVPMMFAYCVFAGITIDSLVQLGRR